MVDKVGDGKDNEGIDKECPDGCIPWGSHMDGDEVLLAFRR